MTRNTFTFRSSWYEAMSRLSGNVRLMLMDAVCRYAIYGELPEPMDDPAAEVAFILIRSEIDSAPCRGRKKAPVDSDRTAPVPEPEQAPASEPEPAPASESAPVSCSDTGDRPEPLSADTVRPICCCMISETISLITTVHRSLPAMKCRKRNSVRNL